jgi:hypothetical protein
MPWRRGRTLPFAGDLLPGAIAAASMTLAAYLMILVLLLVRRGRKWGLALGIGWGAIVAGSALWLWLGPHAKTLRYAIALHLHMTNTLRHGVSIPGPTVREARWSAGLGVLLALGAAKAFADSAREWLDPASCSRACFTRRFATDDGHRGPARHATKPTLTTERSLYRFSAVPFR